MSSDTVLIISSFLTAVISGLMGMIGGITLLSIMTLYFSAAEAIPLHGVVQFFSNFSRVVFHWKYIKKDIMVIFALGVGMGSLAGSQVVIDLPRWIYDFILGFLILLITWIPKYKMRFGASKFRFMFLGAFGGFVSLFVGAVGMLMGAFFLRENLGREGLIGTQAMCQVVVHLAKVITFVALGFTLGKYGMLLCWMVAAGFLGNYVATFILKKIPESLFLKIFKGLVTVLAVRLIASSLH